MAVDFTKDLDFNKMTDEELLEVLTKVKEIEGEGKKPDETKPPEKVSVTLSDGTKIEADNQQELNRLLQAKLEEYRAEPEPEHKPAETPAKPEFDFKEYEKRFLKDPRKAQEYMEITQYGMPVTNMIPFLVAGIAQMAKKVEELEAYRFVSETEGYEASPEARRAIEQVMRERNWRPSYETLQDAYLIAKGRGLIEAKEPKTEKKPYVPPRVSGAGSEPSQDQINEITARGYEMPMEDLEKLLVKAGVIRGRGY